MDINNNDLMDKTVNNDGLRQESMQILSKILSSENIPSINDEENYLNSIRDLKSNCKQGNCDDLKDYQIFSVKVMNELAIELANPKHYLWLLDFERKVKNALLF